LIYHLVKKQYKFAMIIPAFNPGKKILNCLKSIEKSINFFSKKKKNKLRNIIN